MADVLLQDSDGEKSDTDLVVDDVNNQLSPHNGDGRRSSPPSSPPLPRKTPAGSSGGSAAPGAAGSSSAGGGGGGGLGDKLPKREPADQSGRERDTSSRASSGSASGGKHRDVSITHTHTLSQESPPFHFFNNSVKNEWWGAGVVICLERGADLHMAQLMPLPLTFSCFSKIHLGSPGKKAVKRACVCVSKINGF